MNGDQLCPCTAMPTPHRHVTAELSTQIADRPAAEPVITTRLSRSVMKVYCYRCPGRTRIGPYVIRVDGKIVGNACRDHTEPKYWRTYGPRKDTP